MLQIPVIRTHDQLRSKAKAWRGFGERIAIAIVTEEVDASSLRHVQVARGKAERVIAAICPFDERPAPDEQDALDEAEDCLALEGAGSDLVFVPTYAEMFPAAAQTQIRATIMQQTLNGGFEPGYMERWVLALLRQIILSQADFVVMSELDWQFIAILRQVARDLNLHVKVIAAAPAREEDGTPLTWRTEELDDDLRPVAARFRAAMIQAASQISAGDPVADALGGATQALSDAGVDHVDFIEFRDSSTLELLSEATEGRFGRVFGAISFGDIRLYENAPVS